MPHFMKRGRKFGLTSASLDINDFREAAIDTDLTSVSANHDTLASAKTIKDYIDATQTLTGLSDTSIGGTPADNNHLQYDVSTSKWENKPYIDFEKLSSAPANPDTEEGRLYLKNIDAGNNALAIKIQKASNIVEVELTSPGAVCGECGSKDGAKDPTFNFQTGTIIVELYCGHKYEMDIPAWRRI